MTYYSKFDTSIQCEENHEVSPDEYDEVMQLMADEHDASEGYAEWSEAVEKDYLNGYSNSTDGPSYNGCDI